MNDERTPINIFTLGSTLYQLEDPEYNIYSGSTGQTTTSNVQPQTTTFNRMNELDQQLMQQGLKIDNNMTQEQKQNYVDSLTTENYQKMLQYKDAGYSFGASKALLEASQGTGGGGYRGEGFALNEPLGGRNSVRNRMNPIGRIFELVDDQVQQIKDFDDGDDEGFSLWTMIKNIPGSALKTISATARGLTNPLDTANMLKDLVFTSEGRDLLKQRYGSWNGLLNTLEKDPVGLVSDILAVADGGASLIGGSAKLAGAGAKLAGASKTAGALSKFGNTMSRIGTKAGIASDLGLTIPYENSINALTNRLGAGGKLSQTAGAYVSMTQRPLRTIWQGASTNGTNTVLPGVSKALSKVGDSMKQRIQTSATGLTPEVRERIRQNPFIKEYRDRVEAMLNDAGAPMDNQKILEGPIEEVGQELLSRLEEYESRLEADGTEYQKLRATTMPYNLTSFMAGVYDVFAKNGISLDSNGGLRFSRTANPADMNPVITAWNVIKNMEPQLQNMTINQILDFRQQLRSLIKYQSDAPSTKYSKGVIRQLVDGELNKLVHKEIPELEKVDGIYSKEINQLKELKDGLVYQVGEKKGQIKDNFYSIISTLNTQNRQKMKGRLENIFPGIGDRIEAIKMLPTLVKAYQNSPKLVNNMLKTLSALTGVRYTQKPIQLAISWILGIIADEMISKPLGEKWRKQALDELMNEISPEAQQRLAEIKSKVDAKVELTEQDKADLAIAIQEIAQKEYEYLDAQHKKEFDEMMEGLNNPNPALPGTLDTIGPDGTVRLAPGKKVANPEELVANTREERIQKAQEEYGVEPETAEEITNGIEDFLDEIGGDINGNIDTRNVRYERFSTSALEKMMDDSSIPQTEKSKITEILVNRGADVDERTNLDQEFAYRINKLQEEEQRVGKVGKNKVSRDKAYKQQADLESKREALKLEMRERYAGQGVDLDQNRAEDKYAELESKPIDYINGYKKSKQFRDQKAEQEVLNQLKEEWKKQPKFIREMEENMMGEREKIVNNELKNGYERETTDYGDRFINKETGEKGAIKYNKDGTIEVVFTQDSFDNAGVLEILPSDALVRFAGEPDTIRVADIRGDEFQTVGRSNPDQKTVTAEEGLGIEAFKNGRTAQELADDYGLKVEIVDKLITDEGEKALGRYRNGLIELAKSIKEGTAPHEIFHGVFDMVNKKRKEEILKLVQERKGMSAKEAKEWLAESFGDYFLTGKFDTAPIPKGFVNKVKRFFNKVKEFVNGTRKDRKKIQKLYDDIIDGKIERGEIESREGYEYQVDQKSLFDTGEPDNGEMGKFITETYPKIHDKILPLAQKNNYTMEGFARQLEMTYDPDINKWISNLEKEEITLTPEELVNINDRMQEMINNPRAEDVISQIQQGPIMAFNWLIRKMKDNPLDIPEELKGLNKINKENSLTPLERYLNNNPQNIDILYKTYDPDIVEWMNNIKKKFVGGEDITMNELYKLKNLIDEHLATNGIYIDKSVMDQPTAQLLMESAQMAKEKKVGTYDRKQIRKIGKEGDEILQNRIMDMDLAYDRGSIDNLDIREKRNKEWQEFKKEFIQELGKTYDPDVDKWQDNLKKRLKEITKGYDGFKGIKLRGNVITKSGLNSLKAKIKELSKYSYDDIKEAYKESTRPTEGTPWDEFMKAVKSRTEELQTKGVEDAVTNLVAVSNMDVENFEKQMKNFGGKSPMPSIAVMDVNVPHETFGDLTLVFGRDTIDPKIDPANKIYASDAWTPTFPTLKEVRKSGKGVLALHEAFDSTSLEKGFTDIMSKFGIPQGKENIIWSLANDVNHYRLDLQNLKGDALKEKIDQLANKIAHDNFKGYNLHRYGPEPTNSVQYQWKEKNVVYNEIVDKIKDIYTEAVNDTDYVIPASYFDTNPERIRENVDRMAEDIMFYAQDDPAMDAIRGNYDNEERLKQDIKDIIERYRYDGTETIVDKLGMEFGADEDAVRNIIEQYYLPSGDRPVTPENILEAMKNQGVRRETFPGDYADMIEIEGTELKDVEDVRKQNFAKVFHGDRTGDLGDLTSRYARLVDMLKEYVADPSMKDFAGSEMIKAMIKDNYSTDVKEFSKNIKNEGLLDDVPDEVLQRIIDVVEQGKKIPIRFSESKPERIVDLTKEVEYILVPRKEEARVKDVVKGTPLEGKVVPYRPDDYSAPRSRKMHDLQKKYGNVFFSMGGVIMPIAMLYMMMQQEEEGQQA